MLDINSHSDSESFTVTLTAKGPHDAYRLMYAMVHMQVDIGGLAMSRKGFYALRKAMGAKAFDALDESLGGGRCKRYATDPVS